MDQTLKQLDITKDDLDANAKMVGEMNYTFDKHGDKFYTNE